MTAFSYSRLQTYEDCPMSYRLQYLDDALKILKRQNVPGKVGSEVHEILEAYIIHLQDSGLPEDLDYVEYLAETMATHETRADVKHVLEFFSETHVWDTSHDEVFVERPFGITKDLKPTGFAADDTWYRGKIDRLEIDGSTATIVDYKTSRLIPTKVEWETNQQKKSYALFVAIHMPEIKTINIVFDFIRWNVKLTDSYENSPGLVKSLSKIFETKIQEVESATEFPPTPGSFCALCSAFNACPVVKGIYKDMISPEVDAVKDPVEASKRVVAAKRLVKQIEKTLKPIVSENGPIEQGNSVWEFRLQIGAEVIDTNELFEYLQSEKGLQLEEILSGVTLSKTAVKKIQKETGVEMVNKDGTVTEEFETMILPRFTSKFGYYKKK